jgi:hypothetical protein
MTMTTKRTRQANEKHMALKMPNLSANNNETMIPINNTADKGNLISGFRFIIMETNGIITIGDTNVNVNTKVV